MAYSNNIYNVWPMQQAFPGFEPESMQMAAQAYKGWCKSLMTVNAETMKFLTHRFQQDMQFPMSIVQCRSPQDVAQKQVEFWNTMIKDYTQQTQKMQSLLAESFQNPDRSGAFSWPYKNGRYPDQPSDQQRSKLQPV